MKNEDGTVQVVFNGEIYNHRELRSELRQAGHRFRSTADTEVLVHLYEEAQDRMVDRLRGIFAFAIYDSRRHRILLARDRFGVKPLFYARLGDVWLFASEIKAILATSGFRPSVDRQACFDFLGLGYVPEPATAFAEVRALPKGSVLRLGPEESGAPECYHIIQAQPEKRDLADARKDLADRLLDAVAAQSVADVPVAAFLSGGIDSSLVVAAHERAVGQSLRTFNVRFPADSHDETDMALAVARRYGTDHEIVDVGDFALDTDAIQKLLLHFDQPFADTSLLPTYWVSRAVRDRGIVCTLSGDGGHEAFGGYGLFWRLNRISSLMTWPAWARRLGIVTADGLAPFTRDFGRMVGKALRMAEAGRRDSSAIFSGFSNYLTEEQKRELVLPEARESLRPASRLFGVSESGSPRDIETLSARMTEFLFGVGLPSDMLRKVDMMSMLTSIEVRVPLLDDELVELGLTFPHYLKTDGRQGKLVLRELASDWLPHSVAAHPKHGFSIPLDVMLPTTFHALLEDLLLAGDAKTGEILKGEQIAGWLALFRSAARGELPGVISRAGVYQRVFLALALELWLREHDLSW
jgi:asparagine synthase (glutamine-hydrolysing)